MIAGTPTIVSAGAVVVSCGAVNSAALLLRSANEHHPQGLANSSDQVGRNYMVHNNSIMVGIIRGMRFLPEVRGLASKVPTSPVRGQA